MPPLSDPTPPIAMPALPDGRAALEARFRLLCDEIRHYPTPIARCDEQLSGLIEERTRIADALARLPEGSPA